MAAKTRPISGSIDSLLYVINICWSSHEFVFIDSHAMLRTSPMSPTRLYMAACMAAVLASGRAYHHPISRNDIIPTPSQPINS